VAGTGSDALYERYKDALRRGHVAALQGRLTDALTAYAEAASIAPERATPHTSAGTALLRGRRPEDALAQFAVALRLAAGDEAALLGRADALAVLNRPHEAAESFDALAEVRGRAGRLADAVDAARRGLELAEGRDRRRILRALVERLRATEPPEPGRVSLERAVRVLDGPAAIGPTTGDAGVKAGEEPADGTVPLAPDAEPAGTLTVQRVLDRALPPDADAGALARAAEAAMDAGDPHAAVDRLLDLAAARWREDAREAALDACYVGLSIVPDHVALHLALAELYDARGWRTLATDKLALLDRVAALDGHQAARDAVTDARTARG
jgi:tetratricopeptide (TPR) repeat protein